MPLDTRIDEALLTRGAACNGTLSHPTRLVGPGHPSRLDLASAAVWWMVLGGTSASLHATATPLTAAPNPKWRLEGIVLCWEVAVTCVTRRVHGCSALVLPSHLYTFSVRTNPDTELSWAGGVQAAAKRFLPFEEAREFVRKQQMTGLKQWKQWCKEGNRPKDVPSLPSQVSIRPSLLLYENPVACTGESTSGGMFLTDC